MTVTLITEDTEKNNQKEERPSLFTSRNTSTMILVDGSSYSVTSVVKFRRTMRADEARARSGDPEIAN